MLGDEKAAKEAGLMRSEGKGRVVKDGDVALFRFNVWTTVGAHGQLRRASPWT